jgi:hypothetical protein
MMRFIHGVRDFCLDVLGARPWINATVYATFFMLGWIAAA